MTRGREKLTLFLDDMILCQEDSKESTKDHPNNGTVQQDGRIENPQIKIKRTSS